MSITMIKLPLYGLIIVISVLVEMLYIYFSLKKEIKNNKNILLFFLISFFFSFTFGKIFTVIAYNDTTFFKAGLSSYGGLIGIIIGAIVFEKVIPLSGKLIKYSIISLPLTYGISKLACFFSGCCGGIPYTGIFNIIYPFGMNIKQFPIQIVETIVSIIVFFICHKLRKNKNVSYITLLLVSIIKFSLDFLRYEHINVLITKNQIFSIFLFICTLILMIRKNKKKEVIK